jgi:chemotaxis protein MotD
LTAASSAEVATLSAPEAEVAAAGVATATTTQVQTPGKAKTAAVPGKAAASGKDDGKQVIDASTTSAPSEHAVDSSKAAKTTADTEPKTEKSATDKTDSKQDKAATSSDTSDSSKTSANASNTPSIEHRAPTVAPANQPLQPDLSVLAANNQPQSLQLNTPNIAALPAQHLTAAVLTADAPVPLDGLAADIALRAAGGNSRFEIRLDPAELGRIDVRLDVDKHGQVTSHLTVERPATLDMLRRDAPQLQQALEDAGLKTGDSGLQFSLRDQSSSGQQNDNGSGHQSQRLVITEENAVPTQVAGRSYGRMLGSSGGVDIRV